MLPSAHMMSPTPSGPCAAHSPESMCALDTCIVFSIAWRVASLIPRGEAWSRIGFEDCPAAACDTSTSTRHVASTSGFRKGYAYPSALFVAYSFCSSLRSAYELQVQKAESTRMHHSHVHGEEGLEGRVRLVRAADASTGPHVSEQRRQERREPVAAVAWRQELGYLARSNFTVRDLRSAQRSDS